MANSGSSSLVGSIVERKVGSAPSPPAVRSSGKTGFPTVQHRSKSAFARSRDAQKKGSGTTERHKKPPVVQGGIKPAVQTVGDDDEDEARSQVIAQASDYWRRQIEEENHKKIERGKLEKINE